MKISSLREKVTKLYSLRGGEAGDKRERDRERERERECF